MMSETAFFFISGIMLATIGFLVRWAVKSITDRIDNVASKLDKHVQNDAEAKTEIKERITRIETHIAKANGSLKI